MVVVFGRALGWIGRSFTNTLGLNFGWGIEFIFGMMAGAAINL